MAAFRIWMRSGVLALAALAAAASCNDIDRSDGSCGSGYAQDSQLDSSDPSALHLLQTHLDVQKQAKLSKPAGIDRVQADGTVDADGEGAGFWQTGVQLEQTKAEQAKVVATTTPYTHPEDNAAASGVKSNGAGDGLAFITAAVTNAFMVLVCVASFMWLRTRYPMTYQNNLAMNTSPLDCIPECSWGWMKASWRVTTEQAMANVGLDQAMLLEFTHLGMRVTALIGIPMFCIMGPINCFFGGHNAGPDHLSYFSFGNVVNGSDLYWIHALVVWAVVFAVQTSVYKAQRNFLPLRFKWLRELSNPRASTILVEGIPDDYQSDGELKVFFNKMFGGSDKVTSAYVVRSAPVLEAAWNSKEAKKQALEKARFKARQPNAVDADREGVVQLQDELAMIEKEVAAEQMKVKSKASTIGSDGYYASAGFVTFKDRSDAVLALNAQIGHDSDEWEVEVPPQPSSVLYNDLQQGAHASAAFTLLGYALTAGLYMLYMPAVIGITQIAVTIDMGALQPLWMGFAPTLGLQFMIAFLPTFLILIFRICFKLKDDAWAQQMLQKWLFLFQVVFVILVTAIGGSMMEFLDTLVEKPFAIFALLGQTMPQATHFYMNYLALQWPTHTMVLMRYVPLSKWYFFRTFFDDETARQMSEPEDQDYYGIGARSCRMSIALCIAVIYGTLSPPMNVLAFVEFFICRISYGYLIPFAESKKPDLGGVFWVQQLRHVFIGNIIYCIVMTGVLLGRAKTSGPGIIAAASLPYVIWSMKRFEMFSWQNLPFKDLMDSTTAGKQKPDSGEYVQAFMK
jgi:hypothetical protein